MITLTVMMIIAIACLSFAAGAYHGQKVRGDWRDEFAKYVRGTALFVMAFLLTAAVTPVSGQVKADTVKMAAKDVEIAVQELFYQRGKIDGQIELLQNALKKYRVTVEVDTAKQKIAKRYEPKGRLVIYDMFGTKDTIEVTERYWQKLKHKIEMQEKEGAK